MHVAAKLGLAIAGGAASGIALGALSNGDKPTNRAHDLIGAGIGASTLAIGTRAVLRGTMHPLLAVGVTGLGAMTATMAVLNLFQPSSHGSKIHAPGPMAPGPHPTERPTDRLVAGSQDGPADPLRPEAGSGAVEEEVETYGPDGEWLGTEHGTVGG